MDCLPGFAVNFGLDDQRAVLDLADPLALERLNKVSGKFEVSGNVLPDLLEKSANQFDIGVERNAERQAFRSPSRD